MPSSPLPFEILCPDECCPGKIEVGDDGIASCTCCKMQVGMWGPPREKTHRGAPRRLPITRSIAVASVLLLCLGLGFFAGGGVEAFQPERVRAPEALTYGELLNAIAVSSFPEDVAIPVTYRDPSLFLKEEYRQAQSGFVTLWNGFNEDQKLQILNQIKDSRSPMFLPFVIEITFFTIATEPSRWVSRGILDAISCSALPFLDVLIVAVEYLEANTRFPSVAEYAEDCLEALNDRRARHGR